MWTQSEGRRQKAEGRSGENLESEILYKGLGSRVLRQLRMNREIRRIPESKGEVTARRGPRPTGRAKLPLSPIQSPVAVSTGQFSWADKVGGPVARIFHYPFKFLTVRNLISPTAASTYDYVSVNSLQCENRGHGAASPPSPSPSDGGWGHTPGKSRLGRSFALPAWGGSDYATSDLLFACFVANLATQYIQPQLITSIQCEFLTVRNLKKG